MNQLLRYPQGGFGAIFAIMILVILATLSAGLVKLGTTQQVTSAQDILSERAWQAARAGNEWGMYRALRLSPKVCSGIPETLDLSTTAGFRTTVTCTSHDFNEGEITAGVARTISIYTLEAVACNSNLVCPDASMSDKPNYIERKRVVTVCDSNLQAACY
jgi:MSHA biogenesis protein MshP